MRIWRICRKPFARTPFDGRGGLVVAGRWHTPRRLVAYASESLALASLEVLVHCDIELLPSDLIAVELDVPAKMKIAEVGVRDLPRAWRKHPGPRRLQEIGNEWLDRGATAVLKVPSALVPTESNYLVNPVHADFSNLRIVRRLKFDFDERITARGKETS
jgi:RES domain-containing protein